MLRSVSIYIQSITKAYYLFFVVFKIPIYPNVDIYITVVLSKTMIYIIIMKYRIVLVLFRISQTLKHFNFRVNYINIHHWNININRVDTYISEAVAATGKPG